MEETKQTPIYPGADSQPVQSTHPAPEDTQITTPPPSGGEPPDNPILSSSGEEPAPKKKGFPWVRTILLGWLIIIIVAAAGGYNGYQQGLDERVVLAVTEEAENLENQYQLGLQDFQAEAYDRARQRFEFILQQDPNHLRSIEMLARTLAILQATATPTAVIPTATPTLTPTPDLRDIEEKFSNAQAHTQAGEWSLAIESLLSLRKDDPEYRAIEVDSLLYVSLRNRGVDKILTKGELEGGLYDLAQAELFGPLDIEAQNYADWARFYTIGASFWGVDWGQAAFYFGQIAFAAPNLHEGNNWTASARYREALEKHIELLAEAEDWCNASEQHEILRSLDPTLTGDEEFEANSRRYFNRCEEDKNG